MTMQIGGLSKKSGVHIETIRYYEKVGVLPKPPRSNAGRRQYETVHLERLKSVKRCRELGFTLNEVRLLLGLVDGGFTCGEVQEITVRHQQEIKNKISDLKRLDKTLGKLAENCKGGRENDCPVIDALFENRNRQ